MFNEAINNPDLQFDDIKIYPTAICKSHDDNHIVVSEIAKWYEDGTYKPYAEENLDDLIDVISNYLANIKPWVRVQRCIRDIPAVSIEAGYKKKSNLAQIIKDKMIKFDNSNGTTNTYEIRSMEVRNNEYNNYKPRLVVRQYNASKGLEYHISIEVYKENIYQKINYYFWTFIMFVYNLMFYTLLYEYFPKWYFNGSPNFNNCYIGLFGFLRLRIDPQPGGDFITELANSALIREVHVYGNSLSISDRDTSSQQHKGYGKLLIKTAEEISNNHGYNKISVISGIGTKLYYKDKCGYDYNGSYMTKNIYEYTIFKILTRQLVIILFIFIINLTY
jgi:elongator complex protein 3